MDTSFIDALPIAAYVALHDEQRSLRWVSSGFEALLGCAQRELLERDTALEALVHPDDRRRIRSAVASIGEHGTSFRSEYRLQGPNDRTVWVRDEAVVGTEEDGSRVVRGVLLDVTSEQLMARLLEDSNARLRLLTHLPAVVWTTNARLELTSMAGRGLAGVVGEADDFPGAGARSHLQRALAGDAVSFPLRYGDRDFEVNAQALQDEAATRVGVIGVALDVTERRRAEMALKEREAQLWEARKLEALGRLAGGIAHDFNNLLTTISGNAHLILEEVEADDPVRAEAESIRSTAARAEALVDRLFTFARSGELHVEDVDVNRVISQLHSVLRQLVPKATQLVLSLDPDIGLARVDPARLEQVIMNLVVNAGDAMPDGGTLTVKTGEDSVSGDPDGDPGSSARHRRVVVLTVSDTGSGMDAETQSRIFEPFFTTKSRSGGVGLGLATVQRIVEESKGRIVVESAPGRGSTFRVFLPASSRPCT